MSFKSRVISIVSGIPKGETRTYGEVAKMAGNPNASRAVGNIMASNQDKTVPCHRVIRADGKVGKYNGLQGEKEKLLRSERAIK